FGAKKDEIVGPVLSDFGYHIIRVTDVKPEKGKSLAEATPEIEAELKKSVAARRFAEVAEGLTNMVYEQSTSLKPAADQYKLTVQQTNWFAKAGGAPPLLANPKLLAEIFSDNAIKAKRNTAAIEVAPSVLVAARVLEFKPAEQRPYDAVRALIEARTKREEALKLAVADGEAKLKAAAEGKDAGLKWPAPLAVSRQKPGGLSPAVLDKVFRADAKKLPAVVGLATPAGYSLVRITKVMEVDAIDDAKRKALAERLKQTLAMSELESTLKSLRGTIGVEIRKDALDKKASP
ncbi:MAG TPA: peptidyl-prolyl cis-trans isomerase, partial [Usitatibacteraceae bacterium]|nr:peptidyl-prolyl cis-trans isomerase [Usitatibacteraceae bacterium]